MWKTLALNPRQDMKLLWPIVLLVGSCVTQEGPYDRYHQVLINSVNHEWQFDILRLLRDNGKAILWEDFRPHTGSVDILLTPGGLEAALTVIEASGMIPEILNNDFQQKLDEEFEKYSQRRAYDPDDFNTVEDIYDEIDRLAAEECPTGFTCEVRNIGTTYEGRDIRIISITQGSGRRSVWYDSLIHSREWLAGSTCMLILDALMTGYGSDDIATNLLDNYDFHYVPVLNPDGYAYTWSSSTTRMWRKNRIPNEGSTCMGVDLNRNSDGPWNSGGSSSNPCSDTYHGQAVNSELETKAFQDEVTRLGNVDLLVSVHCCGRMMLLPYGTDVIYPNCNQYEDYDDLLANAAAAVDAIHEVSPGTGWRHGDICNIIYIASGGTIDWAKLRAGVKYGMGVELRSSFIAPPSEIRPSFEENYAALGAMIDYMTSQ